MPDPRERQIYMYESLCERRLDLKTGSTLTARVYEILRDQILSRELLPGTRLKYTELADTLGVSITPVREAILELERDGLVETYPYRGSIVKEMSAKEICDVYDVRMALEALAARVAAERMSDELLRELERHVRAYEVAFENQHMSSGLQADLSFHEVIMKASENSVLLEIASKLANRVQIFRQMDWQTAKETRHGHRAVFRALSRRDGNAAASAMAQHIARGKAHALQILDIRGRESQGPTEVESIYGGEAFSSQSD